MNFIGISHFAPCRDATGINVPHYAILKPAHNLGMIVIGHLTTWSGFVNCFNFCHYTFNWTHQAQGGIDGVGGQIPHVARGHTLAPPIFGQIGVG